MEVNILYLIAIIAILTWLYRAMTKHRDYFHDKPIPSMAVKPLFGSTAPLLLKKYTFADFIKMIYDKYEGAKVFGMIDMGTRMFVIRDPEVIKTIAVKDFDHFIDRRQVFGDASTENSNVFFTKTLFGMKDQRWRDMRATLSPAFTGSKMRTMFQLMAEYSNQVVGILHEKAVGAGYVDEEMKDLFTRIANDIIATCAFGLQVESVKGRDNNFYLMGKKMIDINKLSTLLKVMGFRLFPSLMVKLGLDIIDRDVLQYFSKIIKDAVGTREAHGIVRPDMINLLMQARKGTLKHQHDVPEIDAGFATVQESHVGQATINTTMNEQEMIAQCLLFFIGGFDSTSTGFMFMAYELALNQAVQQKLYEEIVETNKQLAGKPLTYDVLQGMEYMDMVVAESLRKAPIPAIDRLCVRDYNFDDGEGLKFTIEKDTCVWFPIYGIHNDPKYYPNPDQFDPERFSKANRANINPATYLPFGIGPRNCIGSRFALMEMKAIMYQLLLTFNFERNEQTQVPIQMVKGFTGAETERGMHLRLKLRE